MAPLQPDTLALLDGMAAPTEMEALLAGFRLVHGRSVVDDRAILAACVSVQKAVRRTMSHRHVIVLTVS